jgi:hypothetical protein
MAQTRRDWEQVFIVDDTGGHHVGGNLAWANTQLYVNRMRPVGEYVFLLDDDGVLVSPRFTEYLRRFALDRDFPEVVLLKSLSLDSKNKVVELPVRDIWDLDWELGERPPRWSGNGYCVCARRDVFRAGIAGYWGVPRGGDWYYAQRMIEMGCGFSKLDMISARSTLIGKGRVFEKCEPGWWGEFAKRGGITETAPGDWRLICG